ncbi:MAG: sensor domain-containing diguanylate cyclase, partial [Aquabacterium sp.]|nr:sensor domain-containing diguanylate cyclase [Aquabacterium sp.]
GYSLKELQQMKPYDLKMLYSKEKFLELINPLLRGEISVQMVDTLHRRKNETFYDVHVNLQLMEVDGVEKFVAIVNDITEYKKTLEEKKYYYELSSHDHLTKIFNRQMFDELFAKEVERSRRYDFALSLILIDIDFFKKVNDTFGHQAGDKVLQVMSAHVKESLRDSDIFARWGGEEFVILMPYTDIAMAVEKAESLRMSIEKLIIEGVGTVTCSFGVAQLSNFENANQIFAHVDKALYKAKEKGRNRVESIGYDGNNQIIS